MEKAPFNLKERKITYKNSVFNVYFDHLEKDGKSLVKDYLVVEPKIKKENGVSGVAILPKKNNQYGLIKIYRHAISEFTWEVPRGFVDVHEDEVDAAVRELKEETGIVCLNDDMHSLGYIYPEPGAIAAKVQLFVACIKIDNTTNIENELGHLCFDWFTPEEIDKLIKENKMNDATSQLLYFKHKFDNI